MLLVNQQMSFKIIHYPYLCHFYKENNIIVDAIRDRNQNSEKEFLLAGRNLSVFPVALSLLSSFISAITLLGTCNA
jgi:Na+/pantothenate symporter